jgi:hypothetical protein
MNLGSWFINENQNSAPRIDIKKPIRGLEHCWKEAGIPQIENNKPEPHC